MIGRLIYAQQDYTNPNSLASQFRAKRFERIKLIIGAIAKAKGQCSIIDLGGRPEYWQVLGDQFLEEKNVQIKSLNLGGQEKFSHPRFEQIVGSACDVPFADMSFDLCHSNSVIEHVGDWINMERFAKETMRLAPNYYVQCPYFWFPIEPHFSVPFFHWFPENMRARALLKKKHGFQDSIDSMNVAMTYVQDARLLDKAQMRALFSDGELYEERFLGLVKSLMMIRLSTGLKSSDEGGL